MGIDLGLGQAATYIGSWGVMMAVMMLPSALPMITLYSTISPGMAARHGRRAVSTAVFAALYLVLWLATGLVAYAGAVLTSTAFEAIDGHTQLPAYASGAVLVGAGLYQFSSAKRTCLRKCRGPLAFLAEHWRPGVGGAIRVGVAHAAYCIGCCWALMVVLVVAGAMGLASVLLIAVLVFAEKVLPYGDRTARVVGVALVLLGLTVLVQPELATALRA